MTDTWGDEWDHIADVVVVGAGAAGSAAAARATAAGAEVIVLEKAASPGGTTAASRSQLWIPNNRFLRAAGHTDPKLPALQYMARTAYPHLYDPQHATLGLPDDRYRVIEAFYDHAAATIDAFIDDGAMAMEPVDFPNYYAQLAEDQCPVGRTIQPILADDHQPGRDPSGGQTMVDRLLARATDRGATVLLDHRVSRLVRDDSGRVIGLEVRAGMGTVLVGARSGVIFTTGGFLHDRRLALDHLKGPVFGGAAAPSATGDFVRIAGEVGARFGNMAHAWWNQTVVELAVINRATRGDVYYPFGDSMLMVNRFGVRAVNEKAPYNERGQVHFAWDPHRGEYPNLLLFWIFDQAVVDSPGRGMFRWPVPADDRARHYVLKADTLEDLTAELEQRLEGLAPHTGGSELDDRFVAELHATIERFNEHAAAGSDPDFRRGETPIERRWAGDPRPGAASASMYPLASEGPYYCIILGPGALDTKGGPVTDEHARVLDGDGRPILGLYGAGNCVASPAGQAYWGPGGTIGPAVTFGAIAASHAAQLNVRS